MATARAMENLFMSKMRPNIDASKHGCGQAWMRPTCAIGGAYLIVVDPPGFATSTFTFFETLNDFDAARGKNSAPGGQFLVNFGSRKSGFF